MISNLTLARFKSVYDETTLNLAPLTVFAGTNNSGKSTVLQSILLTAQSLQSPVQRPITLNGHLVRLGTFDDILSSGAQKSQIKLGFTLSDFVPRSTARWSPTDPVPFTRYLRMGGEQLVSVHCEVEFSPTGSTQQKQLLQLQPSLDRVRLEVQYRDEESSDEKEETTEVRRSDEDLRTKLDSLGLKQVRPDDLPALQYRVSSPSVYSAGRFYKSGLEIIGAVMYHFLPRALLGRYDEVDEYVTRVFRAFSGELSGPRYYEDDTTTTPRPPDEFKERFLRLCESAVSTQGPPSALRNITLQRANAAFQRLVEDFRPRFFRELMSSLPPGQRTVLSQRIGEETPELEKILRQDRPAEYRTRTLSLSDEYESGLTHVLDYFQRCVKYLAPLRDEPKPVYPLAGTTDPTDVGLKGEHTAAVLDSNRNQRVEYVSPDAFVNPLAQIQPIAGTLESAVLAWMRYMGVVTEVTTDDMGKLGHGLRVSTDHQHCFRDLTHVGVGVSQVLPIVVLALLAQPGSTMIFEQPELHLHPRVQSRLADFFLSMSLLSKQCIVETHSEHIVNRLRQRVADTGGDEFSKTIRLFFAEAIDGKSRYTELQINRYGAISNWPKGFFDEGEELAAGILRANLEKRSSVRRDD